MQENCKNAFAVKMSDFSPLFYCIKKNFVITLKAVPAEEKNMRYALIGCGRVSVNHVKAARDNGFDIAAVCDTDASHIDRMFENSGASENESACIRRFFDWNEMLDAVHPDIVSIALPSGLHAEAACDVILRGINCIIEKPMAMSIEDADRIIAAAEKTGVTVSVCHQNRFNDAVREMRSELERGHFGRLSNAAVTVRWHRDKQYYSQASWRGKWASDGGTLMNQCIHGIDLLRWMCGDEIESVYGITNNVCHPYIEAEDIGAAVIKFKNGIVATVEGTVNVNLTDMEEHLTLIGEHGSMKLGGTCANTVEFRSFDGEPARSNRLFHENVENVYGNGHTRLFGDVAAAIKEHRAPFVDVYAGKRAIETVLAIYKSAHDGVPVRLPLDCAAATDFDDTVWGERK